MGLTAAMGVLVDHDIGLIVAQVRARGLSNPFLFDVYGTQPPRAAGGEAAAYREIAICVLGCIMTHERWRSRSGTHFRIAGAILRELCTANVCPECRGSLRRVPCKTCHRTGLAPASVRWRASAADCNYKDFKLRLNPIYERTLIFVARSMRARNSLMPESAAA